MERFPRLGLEPRSNLLQQPRHDLPIVLDQKPTVPGEQGVVNLSPHEFLDRLADPVPPPRKHRHRYHGVFAANHPLRPLVTALAIGNAGKTVGKATGELGKAVQFPGGADNEPQTRSHDTFRIAWAADRVA